MATIDETYANWRSTLKEPDDSLFYCHPSLDRIILGLAIYVISSKPLVKSLGKAESLSILNIYAKDMITAWIDEHDEAFATMFGITMPMAEMFIRLARTAEGEYPSSKRVLNKLAALYAHATALGGDLKDEVAEELLDDLSTDGKELYSEKIESIGEKLLFLTKQHGIDIPVAKMIPLGI